MRIALSGIRGLIAGLIIICITVFVVIVLLGLFMLFIPLAIFGAAIWLLLRLISNARKKSKGKKEFIDVKFTVK